jgi:hypothetical protein
MTNGHLHPTFGPHEFTGSNFTGTIVLPHLLEDADRKQQIAFKKNIVEADVRAKAALQLAYLFFDIEKVRTAGERIFDAIQALYLSSNTPRDRQIAVRITALHRDAIAEDERILPESLAQFAGFFLNHRDLGIPKITLTPDGTLRARWIHGQGNFVAIEFTGQPLAKLVAELPREKSLTATHFSSEPVDGIVSIARAIGASFT